MSSMRNSFLGVVLEALLLLLVTLQNKALTKSIDKQILDAAKDAGMLDVFHLMDQSEFMIMSELDLLLTLDQYGELYSGPLTGRRNKRKAARNTRYRWTNCQVFYEITSSLNSPDNKDVIKRAIKEWEAVTCLTFQESNTKPNRIQFKYGEGCYSRLGMQAKPQPLVLAEGCMTKGIIVHEIGHALGFYHEHMRPDRDKYVQIVDANIPDLYKPNYRKYNSSVIDDFGVTYDYTSIMHYGNEAVPGSIRTLDPNFQDKIGQRDGLSFKDIKLANLMYNCSMFCTAPKPCPLNGFVLSKSYKGEERCTCWCDSMNASDSLVPCTAITREPPPPITVDIGKPGSIICKDIREDCTDLKLQDSHVCMNQMKLMMAVCKETCGFCGKGEKMCMDHEKSCPIFAAAKKCDQPGLGELMRQLCPASCKSCEPSEPCDIQHEMMDFSSDQTYNRRNGGWRLTASWIVVSILMLMCCLSSKRLLH